MKKILLWFICFILSLNITFWDYSSEIRKIEGSIQLLQSTINKIESEKILMISKYDSYIDQLKKDKDIALQNAAITYSKLGLTFSSSAIETTLKIESEYNQKLQYLINEKEYSNTVYDENISNLKLRIVENESLKNKYYKLEQLEKIEILIFDLVKSKKYDEAIMQSNIALQISRENNFTSSISFYENFIKDIQNTKSNIDELNKQKQIEIDRLKQLKKQEENFKKSKLFFNNIKKQLSKSSKEKQQRTYNSLLKQLEAALPKLKWDKKELVAHLIDLIKEELQK